MKDIDSSSISLQSQARKEIERTDRIMENLEVIDVEKAGSLMEVLKSYHADCRGFLEKGQFLQSLEAAFICWAYVDAGLHLGVFKIPDEMKEIFTI